MMSNAWTMIRRAFTDFSEDECLSNGAALAYYTIFSLPPLLAIVFVIAHSLGVPQEKIDQIVRDQLGMPTANQSADSGEGGTSPSADGSAPDDPTDSGKSDADATSSTNLGQVASGANVPGQGSWFSRIAGVVILVMSATGLLGQLQLSLNRAWEVQPDPQQSFLKNFAMKRIVSLGMIVVVAFLLLVALVVTTLIDEILHMLSGGVPGELQTVLAYGLNLAANLLIASLMFAAMFKILPDAKLEWRDVGVGAAVTAVLFVVGKELIGIYLQSGDVASGWGAATASMVSILIWVYYTSLIVLFGAEFTQVWADMHGRKIEPVAGAVRTDRACDHRSTAN